MEKENGVFQFFVVVAVGAILFWYLLSHVIVKTKVLEEIRVNIDGEVTIYEPDEIDSYYGGYKGDIYVIRLKDGTEISTGLDNVVIKEKWVKKN